MEGSPKSRKPNDDAKFLALGLRLSGVVFEFVGVLGILGYVGYRVDLKYECDPWGLLVGMLLGLGLGLFVMIRQLNKLNR